MRLAAFGALAAALFIPVVAFAGDQTEGQKNEQRENQIPRCSHRLGTVAIVEPERNWWSEYNLGSPEALIKIFVMRSGCFGLVDRGKGMAAIQRERELAGGGELRQGSNMGKGQIKAADYVLVPDLVSQNRDSGGTNIGGYDARSRIIGSNFNFGHYPVRRDRSTERYTSCRYTHRFCSLHTELL